MSEIFPLSLEFLSSILYQVHFGKCSDSKLAGILYKFGQLMQFCLYLSSSGLCQVFCIIPVEERDCIHGAWGVLVLIGGQFRRTHCPGLPGGGMSSSGSGSQGKLGSSPTQAQLVLACWGALLVRRDRKQVVERESQCPPSER